MTKAMEETEVLFHLGRIHQLPAMPMVVTAVSRTVNDPGSNAQDIARLLSHDQGLTARVLKLANSAFYAPREPVRTPEHAVVLLGLSTIRAIIFKASIFSTPETRRAVPFWLHALGVACAARVIARRQGLDTPDDAFVMGLLHDIGKLALRECLPERYAEIDRIVARKGCHIGKAEREVLGTDHSVVGRFLAEKWSLPRLYREAIAHHHDLQASPESMPFACCVHLADALTRAMLIGNSGDPGMPLLDSRALDVLGLDSGQFTTLMAETEDELGRAEVFFDSIAG